MLFSDIGNGVGRRADWGIGSLIPQPERDPQLEIWTFKHYLRRTFSILCQAIDWYIGLPYCKDSCFYWRLITKDYHETLIYPKALVMDTIQPEYSEHAFYLNYVYLNIADFGSFKFKIIKNYWIAYVMIEYSRRPDFIIRICWFQIQTFPTRTYYNGKGNP